MGDLWSLRYVEPAVWYGFVSDVRPDTSPGWKAVDPFAIINPYRRFATLKEFDAAVKGPRLPPRFQF